MIIARLLCALLATASIAGAQPQSKPIKRPPHNQLAIESDDAPNARIDSPGAISALTNNLTFHVSPLSNKGLLSQQVEDALKALDKANGNATFVKLRAFVSGTGDLRRVQTIVNTVFTSRKLSLPVLTTVQTGPLTLEGAQVVIESISEEKKTVNPSGLVYFAAVEASSGAAAITTLDAALKSANAAPLSVTCFADSLTEARAAQSAAAKTYPRAAATFVQSTRYTMGAKAACEAVAQASSNSPGATRTPKLVFTAPQMAFSDQQADLELAITRLNKTLEPYGVNANNAVLTNFFSLTRATADKSRALAGAGRATSQLVESLPSLDAAMAVEAVIPLE